MGESKGSDVGNVKDGVMVGMEVGERDGVNEVRLLVGFTDGSKVGENVGVLDGCVKLG